MPSTTRLLLAAVLAPFLPILNLFAAQSRAPGEVQFERNLFRQIASLEAHKELRTPAQQKLDSQLIYAWTLAQGSPIADAVATLRVDLDRDAHERVLVDMDVVVTPEILTAIANGGGEVLHGSVVDQSLRAWVPLAEIETLAGDPTVRFIRPATRAEAHAGSKLTEGDKAHAGPEARNRFKATGSGIKVGVMSDSIDHLAQAQASRDLPSVVTVATDDTGKPQDGIPATGEGTAILEIVHDMAPDADLFFATAFGGPYVFAQNIRRLRFGHRCDVIVDDVEYFNESPFQDGPIARAVSEVVADGCLYFSSAGNSGNFNDGTSSVWEGDFVDSGSVLGSSSRIHRFGLTLGNRILPRLSAVKGTQNALPPEDDPESGLSKLGGQTRADLFWAEPLGGASSDYDLYVVDELGNIIAASTNRQSGFQDPYESLGMVREGERLVVALASGVSRYLHLNAGRSRIEVSTAGRTKGHSAVLGAMSVGAVDARRALGGNFVGGGKNPVQTYSSDGPRRMFFNPQGTPYNGANWSSSGGIVRQKPDIAAADSVSTTWPGVPVFSGTSAAAPHAAAIAALLKSYNPNLSAFQIRQLLVNTSLDIEAIGVDRDSGAGIVMAEASLDAAPPPTLPILTDVQPGVGDVGQVVEIIGSNLAGALSATFGGVSAPVLDAKPGSIRTMVPVGARTGTVRVTTAVGPSTSPIQFKVNEVPVILSSNPGAGGAGTGVDVQGDFLDRVTAVRFAGVGATFTKVSATLLRTTVPSTAATGRIQLVHPGGVAQSRVDFRVVRPPVISSYSPTRGASGTVVTIRGANLGSVTNARFSGLNATGRIISPSELSLTVPPGAVTGPIELRSPDGSGTSDGDFVILPPPRISFLAPNRSRANEVVLIGGNNLDSVVGVTFNGRPAGFTIVSPTLVFAVAPANAGTGRVQVQTEGGVAVSGEDFTVVPPPANDRFLAASSLSGTSGSAFGLNEGATKEPGEPNPSDNKGGRSIWYRWTAPATGIWTFDTQGSNFDTILGVYSGSALGQLAVVGENDDAGSAVQHSRVTFAATAGSTFRILVDGFATETAESGEVAFGTIRLNWDADALSPVLTSFSPTQGTVGTPVTIQGANFKAPLRVAFGDIPASGTFTATTISVTVPPGAESGPITVSSPGGTNVSAASFMVIRRPPNDAFAGAQTITGSNGEQQGSFVNATREPGEPVHARVGTTNSVWFVWTAPSNGTWKFETVSGTLDTSLAVYTGTTLSQVVPVASNDDAGSLITSGVAFRAVQGRVYRIAADVETGPAGSFLLRWSETGSSPVIADFNPPTGGVQSWVTIEGANLVAATNIFLGDAKVDAVELISPNSLRFRVPSLPANTAHTIAIASGTNRHESSSPFWVSDAPSNDNLSSPIHLAEALGMRTQSNIKATLETGEPDFHRNLGGRSLWFTWRPDSAGTWAFDTEGSSANGMLTVYDAFPRTNSVPISAGYNVGSKCVQAVVSATGGRTYWIAVSGLLGDAGDLRIRWLPSTQTSVEAQQEFDSGFNASLPLRGQRGWTGWGSGQNGLIRGALSSTGLQAYVGWSDPSGLGSTVVLPASVVPNTSRPIASFRTKWMLVDSTNGRYDAFEWQAYNQRGDRLLSIGFDNIRLELYLVTGGTSERKYLGKRIANGVGYAMEIVLDLPANRFWLFHDEQEAAHALPISLTGIERNIGLVGFTWIPTSSAAPGNNYLVFDDVQLDAGPQVLPHVVTVSSGSASIAGRSLTFSALIGGQPSFEYQWHKDGVMIPDATNPILTRSPIRSIDAGIYSLHVRNRFGSLISTNIPLSVAPPEELRLVLLPELGQMTAQGTPEIDYEIQSSPDLRAWTLWGSVRLPSGGRSFLTIPNISGTPALFFRAKPSAE
jgi:hypothetical protein